LDKKGNDRPVYRLRRKSRTHPRKAARKGIELEIWAVSDLNNNQVKLLRNPLKTAAYREITVKIQGSIHLKVGRTVF